MPRGAAPGERRGGRSKGTLNKKTIERQQAQTVAQTAVVSAGMSPLDVMLETMRYFNDRAATVDDEDVAWRCRMAASENASRAAPYIHPKLSAVELSGSKSNPIVMNITGKVALL